MDSKAAALKRDRKSKSEGVKTGGTNKGRPKRSSSAENTKARSPSPLPNTSPGHTASMSSYDADELTLRDEFSEGEKGYHTDQDSGFQVIRTRKRYSKHNRIPHQTQGSSKTSSSPVTSSSLSAASFSLVSGPSASESAAMTSRGYESEKEFYPEEDFRLSQVVKRKTASSMPHSERNSPENSDLDSSLSLPFVHRSLLPRQVVPSRPSYAATVAASSTDPVMMTTVQETIESVTGLTCRPKSEDVSSAVFMVKKDNFVVKRPQDRNPLKKQNSVPTTCHPPLKSLNKTKGHIRSLDSSEESQVLPPVIMCHDDQPSPNTDLNPTTTVTFGFFDDESSVDETTLPPVVSLHPCPLNSTKPKQDNEVKQVYVTKKDEKERPVDDNELVMDKQDCPVSFNTKQVSTPLVLDFHGKKRRELKSCSDIDVNSYNYYEVLAYIKKGEFTTS